jgi:hypothetical protein
MSQLSAASAEAQLQDTHPASPVDFGITYDTAMIAFCDIVFSK